MENRIVIFLKSILFFRVNHIKTAYGMMYKIRSINPSRMYITVRENMYMSTCKYDILNPSILVILIAGFISRLVIFL